jgi:OPA family glycerol-3-phosphate transporter-like MFS transporter
VDKVTQEVVPILILIVAIALVVSRLPKIDLGHSEEFKRRRILNWVPLGLTYAFLYMGRYNLNALKDANLISGKDFGDIDAIGALTYGFAFLINGPLCDKLGGRFTMLVAAVGAAVANAAIGILYWHKGAVPSVTVLIVLNAINMYFQSFGAVSIVKVNASWFHLRERGTFGGIFGILISLGLYLAYDWAPKLVVITNWNPTLFLAPALLIGLSWIASFIWVRDTPADAGLGNFDVEDASSGDTGPPEGARAVIWRMLNSRIIMTIALISACSGFLRQGILKWFRTFAGGVGLNKVIARCPDDGTWACPDPQILNPSFVVQHWGMVSCVAGILGGVFAGVLSDHLFKSRRPPVAVLLFGLLLAGAIAIIPALAYPIAVSGIIAFMAMAVIGVHGMLSGVASQDFGGRRNAGTATGLIDGFVYFGTALQAFVYGHILPESKIFVNGVATDNPEAANISNWYAWPIAMVVMAVIGIILSLTVINARVAPRKLVGTISPEAGLPKATALDKD